MTTLPTVYQFHGAQVRVINREDGPRFIAADVCAVLKISDVRQAIGRLDKDERGGCIIPTPGGTQLVRSITESGLYSLILTSRVPSAKAFKKWVTTEVLPSIRKHGAYIAGRRRSRRASYRRHRRHPPFRARIEMSRRAASRPGRNG